MLSSSPPLPLPLPLLFIITSMLAFLFVDLLYDSQQPSFAGASGDGAEDSASMVSVVVLVATMMIVREKAKVSSNLLSNLRLAGNKNVKKQP